MERSARKEHRWCVTTYPTTPTRSATCRWRTTEFVYGAGMLNEDDPVAFSKRKGNRSRSSTGSKATIRVALKGPDVDMTFSIKEPHLPHRRRKIQLPRWRDLHSTVEKSANGWIRYKYPAIANNGSSGYRAVV